MICTTEDDYVQELQMVKKTAVWVAVLSDDTHVYMDDHRPDAWHHSAWVRLSRHCQLNGLSIRKLYLKFRSEERHTLPENAEGYFFCKSALRAIEGGDTYQFYVIGALTNGVLAVQKWKVPELFVVEAITRDPEKDPECLIRTPISGQGLRERPD